MVIFFDYYRHTTIFTRHERVDDMLPQRLKRPLGYLAHMPRPLARITTPALA